MARRHCDTGVRARRPRPFRFSWSVAPHSFKFAAAGPWPARAGAGPGLSRAAGVPCRASHVLRPFRQEHHDASRNGPGPSLYCARSLPAAQARSLPARRSLSVPVPARAAAAASLMVTTERHNIRVCDGDSDRALSGAGRGQQSSIATLTALAAAGGCLVGPAGTSSCQWRSESKWKLVIDCQLSEPRSQSDSLNIMSLPSGHGDSSCYSQSSSSSHSQV